MDSDRHQLVKRIFLEAIERPKPQWQAFVAEQAGDDMALRREVEQLLDFHVGTTPGATRSFSQTAATSEDLTGSRTTADQSAGAKSRGSDEPAPIPRRPTAATMPPFYDPPAPSRRVGQALPSEKRASRPSFPMEHGRFLPGAFIAERYRIVALVGKGGMGEVYRADDTRLGQAVALKFLPPALAANPKRLEQFMNEVRIARQVSHPNVCRVYDIGEHGDEQFISMEYVDGETLDSLISRIGRIPERKAVQLAQELCAALGAIHDEGILHRDLKPANIMIDGRGQLLLTDFGLASARELHGFEAASGTPGFVAPESLAGRESTVLSDVYTLGLVLYELFTGVPAYTPGTPRAVLKAQEAGDPPPITTHAEDLSAEVERAVTACLERDPEERPSSAREVASMLPGGDPLAAAIAAGVTPSPELVAASGRQGRVRPWQAGAWLLAFVMLLVGGRVLQERYGLLSLCPLPKSPDVLADRAEAILDRLGYSNQSVDRVYQLDLYEEYIAELAQRDHSPTRWERLKRFRPTGIDFWYRRSPLPIATMNPMGWVSWQDPPHETPGMISLRLTPNGYLRELVVVDPKLNWQVEPKAAFMTTVKPTSVPIEPDWGPLFESAGLDIAKFQRISDPERIPLVFADTRAAWLGHYPESPDEPVRVEAAGLRGRPVAFRSIEVDWPLAQNIGAIELGSDQPNTKLVYEVLTGLVLLIALVAVVVLARTNLRLKRSDRTGAVRLALVVFITTLLSMLGAADTFTSFSSYYSPISNAIVTAVAFAVAIGVAYIAIEPYIRRIWPETLIAWTRLISGQVVDPLVGQSVLVGACLGVFGMVVMLSRHMLAPMLPTWMGSDAGVTPPPFMDYSFGVEPFGSFRQGAGIAIQIVTMALKFAVVFTIILVLLRLLLKRTNLALMIGALVFGGLWALRFNVAPWSAPSTWLLYSFGALACGTVLVRFGVLSLMIGAYVYYTLKVFPYTLTGVWYANIAIVATGFVCVLAIAGACIAVFGSSRRSVFGLAAPTQTRAAI